MNPPDMYSNIMTPAPAATPAAKPAPTTDQAALEQKAMQTILGMFNQASQADVAEMNAMRPQMVSAPGGVAPLGMHTVPNPVQAQIQRPTTAVPQGFAQFLMRR